MIDSTSVTVFMAASPEWHIAVRCGIFQVEIRRDVLKRASQNYQQHIFDILLRKIQL